MASKEVTFDDFAPEPPQRLQVPSSTQLAAIQSSRAKWQRRQDAVKAQNDAFTRRLVNAGWHPTTMLKELQQHVPPGIIEVFLDPEGTVWIRLNNGDTPADLEMEVKAMMQLATPKAPPETEADIVRKQNRAAGFER